MVAQGEAHPDPNPECDRLQRTLAQAEAALQACRTPLAIIDGVLLRVRWTNPKFGEVFRGPTGEVVAEGLSVGQLFGPDAEAWGARFARVASTGVPEEAVLVSPSVFGDGPENWTCCLTPLPARGDRWDVLCQAFPASGAASRPAAAQDGQHDVAQALKLSEQRFRDISEAAGEFLWEVDPEGRLTYISGRVEAMLGYGPTEVIGHRPSEFMEAADAEVTRALYARCRADKQGYHDLDHRLISKSGQRKWVTASAIPILAPNGDLIGFRGATLDITARKEAEQALRASEEMYRSLLASSPSSVLVLDTEGRIQLVNQLARHTMQAETDPVGQWVFEWVVPEDRPRAREKFAELLVDGMLRSFELTGFRGSGERLLLEISAAVVRGPQGEPRQIVVHAANVTERRRAEEALRQREATLQSIFRAAPVGIGLVVDRVFQEVNDTACQMLGYSREELHGHSTEIIYRNMEDYATLGLEPYRQIRESGMGSLQTRLRRKDGTLIDVLLNCVPVDPADPSRGVTFTALDITEQTRSEQALRESEEMYRSLVSATSSGVTVTDLSGRILMANQAALDVYASGAEVVGRTIFEWVPAEEAERVQRELSHLLATGISKRVEVSLLRSQGERFWADVNGTVVCDPQGRPQRFVLLTNDITPRKEAEDQLREREELFRAIVSQAFDGIVLVDIESLRFVEFNDAACRGLGYTREEFAQLTLFDLQGRATAAQVRDHVEEMRRRGGGIFENVQRCKDGRVRYVRISNRFIHIRGRDLLVGICTDITEAKRFEATLADEATRRRLLFEHSQDGICVLDQTGKVYEANQRFAEMLGYAMDEVQQLHVWDWDLRWNCEQLREIVRTSGTVGGHFETRHRRKDGTCYDVEITAGVSYWAGERYGFCVCRDVSERKRSEALLRLRVELAEMARSRSLDELMRTAADHAEFLTGSRLAFFHLFEADSQQAGVRSGSSNTERLCQADGTHEHPCHPVEGWSECRHAQAAIIHNSGESAFLDLGWPQGHTTLVRELLVPVLREGRTAAILGVANKAVDYTQEDVTVIEELATLVMDVIARKRAEEALRESERRLRLALAASRMGVWEWDLQDRIYWSPECLAMGGLSHFDETTASARGIFHPDDVEVFVSGVRGAVQAGTPFTGEFRIVRPDGELRWISMFGQTEEDANGRPYHFVGTARDVSEQKQAEEARLRLEAQLQHAQKLESLGVLAGGIAHDFNNILAGIRGYAALIREDLVPATPPYERVEEIQAAALRAGELTRQILAYAGKGQLRAEAVNLSRTVEDMRGMLEVGASKKSVFRYQLAADLPATWADASRIRQVVLNLVVNASESLEERSGVVSISTRVIDITAETPRSNGFGENLPVGSYVCLEVADTGCGMEPETLARIFDPFFTTKFTGRGLGLAMVQGIIRSHRGAIHVGSEPGKGSVFQVLLPCCDVVALRVPQATPAPQRGRGHGWFWSLTMSGWCVRRLSSCSRGSDFMSSPPVTVKRRSRSIVLMWRRLSVSCWT